MSQACWQRGEPIKRIEQVNGTVRFSPQRAEVKDLTARSRWSGWRPSPKARSAPGPRSMRDRLAARASAALTEQRAKLEADLRASVQQALATTPPSAPATPDTTQHQGACGGWDSPRCPLASGTAPAAHAKEGTSPERALFGRRLAERPHVLRHTPCNVRARGSGSMRGHGPRIAFQR